MIDEEEMFAEILEFVERGFEIRLQMRQLVQGNFYEIILTDFRDSKVFTAVGIELRITEAWERVKLQLTKAAMQGKYTDDWKHT